MAIARIVLIVSFFGISVLLDGGQTNSVPREEQLVPLVFCSGIALANASANNSDPESVTQSQAAHDANTSSNYTSITNMLGPHVDVNFTGVVMEFNETAGSCSIKYLDWDVAYSLNDTAGNYSDTQYQTGQLSIYVNASTGSIAGTNLAWHPTIGPTRSSSEWTGYAIELPTGSWQEFYSQVTDIGITRNSGNCGTTFYWSGTCGISFWGGLTSAITGKTGIAQSGVDAQMLCYWVYPSSYSCSNAYQAWIEFYPAGISYCGGPGVTYYHPDDLIQSYSIWVGSNSTYYEESWDATSGIGCGAWSKMSMGAPSYAQSQSEPDPKVFGGTYSVPNFNFWYSPVIDFGSNWDLKSDTIYNDGPVQGQSLGTINYDMGVCSGDPWSCYELSH